MAQKANIAEESQSNSSEERAEDIIKKYKELDVKCDYIIEKITKKRKSKEDK